MIFQTTFQSSENQFQTAFASPTSTFAITFGSVVGVAAEVYKGEYTVPFDTGTISMMAVIYKQGGNVVLVKDLEDCTLGDKTVSCTLTEEETSLFKPNPQVQIQLRVGIGNARLNSNILNVSVADVLKDGLSPPLFLINCC